MKGEGAIVFLIIFVVVLGLTIWLYPTLPPGQQIYNMLNVPQTTYPVLGIPATTLIIAVFNGVIYGFIVWLIFTIARRASKPKVQTQPAPQQVQVLVNK
jgi:hypothetical protein